MVSKSVKNSLIASAAGASALAAGTVSASADTVTVKGGDTLWGFAQKFDTSVDEISNNNELTDANLIVKGQKINIPEAGQTVSTYATTKTAKAANTINPDGTITVKAGDSLYGIAVRNNTSVNKLMEINGLTSYIILPGQNLSLNASDAQVVAQNAEEVAAPVEASNARAFSLEAEASTEVADDAITFSTTTEEAPVAYEEVAEAAPVAPAPTPITGSDWQSVAFSLQGIPYVWGGTTADGFDCSGFVQYVRANSGLTDLGRTTTTQAASLRASGSVAKDMSQAQPGDLLFWGGAGAEYHVGIYLGGGQMIDASQPGTPISVSAVWGAPQAYSALF